MTYEFHCLHAYYGDTCDCYDYFGVVMTHAQATNYFAGSFCSSCGDFSCPGGERPCANGYYSAEELAGDAYWDRVEECERQREIQDTEYANEDDTALAAARLA